MLFSRWLRLRVALINGTAGSWQLCGLWIGLYACDGARDSSAHVHVQLGVNRDRSHHSMGFSNGRQLTVGLLSDLSGSSLALPG